MPCAIIMHVLMLPLPGCVSVPHYNLTLFLYPNAVFLRAVLRRRLVGMFVSDV